METPRFEHDCDQCVFLGRFEQEPGIDHDLYFCRAAGERLISRWGADPTDTDGFRVAFLRSEGGANRLRAFPAIQEAMRRAEAGRLMEK